ncbi:MAG: efflux RND transporter permease subunit, partial [Vulcanimicrobiaceae bacterium]
MSSFFLRRPVLSVVCSIIILLAGLVCIPTLPIAQYPQIAPPVVTVTAVYTGASPLAVESQVTTPLENAINGVQGLRYISSSSAQGVSTITCTFALGTNLDIAAADVQNNVQSAIGLLPQTVQQVGITVAKNSGAFVMAIALTSDNAKYDTLFLSNYAQINIVNDLSRIPGVSQVLIFGQRQYAMRIWLNPRELAANGLDTGDVVSALQGQNVEVAAGSVGAPPQAPDQPYTYPVNAVTQLSDPTQFANIILRANPNGGFIRLSDVSRVELGAQEYSSALRFDGDGKVIGLGVLQYSTANALALSRAVTQKLDELSANFPPGVHYKVAFNSTTFVQESIREVFITLLLSILLVVLVIFIFLQDPRSTLIPAATIPVSLIGTFFIMKLFGFTINTITLFGLTLATGLVVDDAIVVIENIARHMELDRGKATKLESATTAMNEVQSAVIASSLVLLAVFVPVAFFPGTTGQLYKQFALTIAASISISLFQALSLAPTLSARLLEGDVESNVPFFRIFNTGLHRFRDWYGRTLPKAFRRRGPVLAVFLGALLLTGFLFRSTPGAFIPDEDQGYFIALVQAPEGTSLAGTVAIAKKAEAIILHTPGVKDLFDVGGFSFAGSAPNRGIMFAQLTPWGTRPTVDVILRRINFEMFTQLPQAQIFALNPPAIQGVGSFGGFQFEIQDRGNVGLDKLMQTAFGVMGAASQDHRLANVFTQFRLNSPQVNADIDRNKVLAIGVPL